MSRSHSFATSDSALAWAVSAYVTRCTKAFVCEAVCWPGAVWWSSWRSVLGHGKWLLLMFCMTVGQIGSSCSAYSSQWSLQLPVACHHAAVRGPSACTCSVELDRQCVPGSSRCRGLAATLACRDGSGSALRDSLCVRSDAQQASLPLVGLLCPSGPQDLAGGPSSERTGCVMLRSSCAKFPWCVALAGTAGELSSSPLKRACHEVGS